MSKKQQYHHVRETLTPTPPPRKTWRTPKYHLDHYTVRRHTHVVTVQLVGIRGRDKRTETISFPLLQGVNDGELVRAAVWFSPNKWIISFGMHVSQFEKDFSRPLNAGLLNALNNANQAQPPSADTQSQPSLHNQPTVPDTSPVQHPFQPPIPQPGQFHQPFLDPPLPPMWLYETRPSLWQWYKTRSRRMQVGLTCAAVLTIILFSVIANAAAGSGKILIPQAASTQSQQAVIPKDTPTPVPTPSQQAVVTGNTPTQSPTATQPAPTPTPTPTPAVVLIPTPTPIPPKPTPPPSCQAVNGNPWCYNFSPGNLIYNPPSNFCAYFNCISSFWEPDDPGDGYVVECGDGTFSQSGGERGACSYHGGVSRPLYSH